MPQTFQEGRVEFSFPDTWLVLRPEKASYYKRHFQNFAGGCKEMDFILFDPTANVLWLLEVKDYTTNPRKKTQCVLEEVVEKSRDSLALLYAGAICDNASAPSVGDFAKSSWVPSKVRVVLHLDQPSKPSRLYPGAKLAADATQALRAKVKAVDSHAFVSSCSGKMEGWTATWNP
jgi:hypothetical protein